MEKRNFREQVIAVLEDWNNYVEESGSKDEKGWNNKEEFQ